MGVDRFHMVAYIGLGEESKWDTPLLAALDPLDVHLELHHQASAGASSAAGATGARGEFLDETARENQRLESSLNPYQVLDVQVDATPTDILTAYQRLMRTTLDPSVANELLRPHYQSAFEILGDLKLRQLYDALSATGQTDCAQIFTSSESKLLVRSFTCGDTFAQLRLLWKAKQCQSLKVLSRAVMIYDHVRSRGTTRRV